MEQSQISSQQTENGLMLGKLKGKLNTNNNQNGYESLKSDSGPG